MASRITIITVLFRWPLLSHGYHQSFFFITFIVIIRFLSGWLRSTVGRTPVFGRWTDRPAADGWPLYG